MRLSLEQRTAALLALVEQYRAKRCAELLEPAREQARALLREARAEGRRRVHTTIGEARQRLAAEVGAAQARLATERRLAQQRHAVQVLAHAWSELREVLRQRWRDPACREQWLVAHLARALAALPRERLTAAAQALAPARGIEPGHDARSAPGDSPGQRQGVTRQAGSRGEGGTDPPCQVEFAADWPEAERAALAARLAAAGVAGASWQSREDIDGGVRIRAGNNVVDATIEGLLADRSALEGRLLDLLQGGAPMTAAGHLADQGRARRATEAG